MEVEHLGSRVSGPAPQEIVGVKQETVRGFDPGGISERTTFGSGFPAEPAFPAFGFLMMLEEGGIPLRCGGVRIYSEAVAGCARWIKPYAPLWSLSALLRSVDSGQKQELDDWFDRVRVATLPPEQVQRLYPMLAQGWAQSVRYLAGNLREMEAFGEHFSERQVKVLAEVLSRISIRLLAEHRAEMFELAVEMYNHPLFRRYHTMHDCVKSVFSRLLSQAMDQEEILPRVEQLLTLPISNEGGFIVSIPDLWPEPLGAVYWEDVARADDWLDRSSWTASISNVLSVARTESKNARRQAITRLVKLYEIDGLTDDEVTALGEAIWARTHENTGFPSDLPYPLQTYLRLPRLPRIAVEQRYKRNALSQEFTPIVGGNNLNTTLSYDPLARLFRGGPVLLIGRSEEELRSSVCWSQDEAIEMLDKMCRCWDQEKEHMQGWVSGGLDLQSEGSVRGRFLDWVRLMAEVVLPRIAGADAGTKERAKTLLDELGEIDICTSYGAPATLYLDATLYEGIVVRLRAGLNSIDDIEVQEAVRSLGYWTVLGQLDHRLPLPPQRLVDELILNMIARRMPGLETALVSVSHVLRHSPEALQTYCLEGVCAGLGYLLHDTELPAPDDWTVAGATAGPISVAERPNYRRWSAALAAQLSKEFARRGTQPPNVLDRWRKVSCEDPLPEVRRAWREAAPGPS